MAGMITPVNLALAGARLSQGAPAIPDRARDLAQNARHVRPILAPALARHFEASAGKSRSGRRAIPAQRSQFRVPGVPFAGCVALPANTLSPLPEYPARYRSQRYASA